MRVQFSGHMKLWLLVAKSLLPLRVFVNPRFLPTLLINLEASLKVDIESVTHSDSHLSLSFFYVFSWVHCICPKESRGETFLCWYIAQREAGGKPIGNTLHVPRNFLIGSNFLLLFEWSSCMSEVSPLFNTFSPCGRQGASKSFALLLSIFRSLSSGVPPVE